MSTQHFFAILLLSLTSAIAVVRLGAIRPRLLRAGCTAIAATGVLSLCAVAFVNLGPGDLRHSARLMVQVATTASVVAAGGAMGLALLRRRTLPTLPEALLPALGIHVVAMFFGFELGKLVHDAEMRHFFSQSGYSVSFMYFVMLVELSAAVGMCCTRSRPYAAGALAALMLGAIGTHLRNGDPWSDSLDAVRMTCLLGAVLVLWAGRRDAAASAHVA